MTNTQNQRAQLVICQVAQQNDISTAQCRAAMIEAIRDAWNTGDPVIHQRQVDLVGDSHEPTPEELIFSILAKIFTKST